MNDAVLVTPGTTPFATWRAIYFGADVTLPAACRPAVDAAAATVERIVNLRVPVYGINTGFGKLASVSIHVDDLAKLQRKLVLSHASGVGEPLPDRVVRLMLALKIASLAQGASGVRWSTIERLQECLAVGLLPVIPAQGSVGASGDLAPLARRRGPPRR